MDKWPLWVVRELAEYAEACLCGHGHDHKLSPLAKQKWAYLVKHVFTSK